MNKGTKCCRWTDALTHLSTAWQRFDKFFGLCLVVKKKGFGIIRPAIASPGVYVKSSIGIPYYVFHLFFFLKIALKAFWNTPLGDSP
jgi:hypothetical protein